MYEKEAFVHQVFASGALAYVLKAASSSDVIKAVRAAHRGEYFLSSKIRAEVIGTYLESRKKKPAVGGYELLSDREQQVFRLMVEGNSTTRIADILCVSPKTVEKHRANVMRKLGVRDLVAMVKYAIKIGILDPELWKE
jgi:DNA-binding NarL/FixJ family response regulator